MSVLFHIISQNLFFIKFYKILSVLHETLPCVPHLLEICQRKDIFGGDPSSLQQVPYPLLTSFELYLSV